MANAVVNEFVIENGARFSVTVRVSPNRFTNSCLSDFNTTVTTTRLTSVNSSYKLVTKFIMPPPNSNNRYNQKYNKVLESDWLSTGPI